MRFSGFGGNTIFFFRAKKDFFFFFFLEKTIFQFFQKIGFSGILRFWPENDFFWVRQKREFFGLGGKP